MARFLASLTVIIPTLTNDRGLQKLLSELEKMAGLPVVVVDGRPTPVKKRLAEQAKARYLPQESNLGFAGAVNLGAIDVKTEWLLLLNDDLEGVTSQLIEGLLGVATARGWSAVSPTLLNSVGEPENLGYSVLPFGRVALNFEPARATSADLDGLTAACLLIKNTVFQVLGGFDESFFAYLEDVDLFLRLKKQGYTFGMATDLSVVHRHLTTSSQMPGFKAKQDLKNWWRLWYKHPQVIRLSPAFLGERLRNLSGWVKGWGK